jgi:hypothetical protein
MQSHPHSLAYNLACLDHVRLSEVIRQKPLLIKLSTDLSSNLYSLNLTYVVWRSEQFTPTLPLYSHPNSGNL